MSERDNGPPVRRRLDAYAARRASARGGEPAALPGGRHDGARRFVVQKHAASSLHYDFRIAWQGALLSWAVTKGPSRDPSERRLAVRTEDHPLAYAEFEGTIPEGDYGAGTVMLWDEGTWTPRGDVAEGLAAGEIKMTLEGHRMRGDWVLIRMNEEGDRENWLLIKEKDNFTGNPDTLTEESTTSVRSGRSMEEIAAGAPPKGGPERREGAAPAFRAPQLATLVEAAPEGDDWWHETKFDGYRALVALGAEGATLYSRSGQDWTGRFAALEGAFDALACDTALIDGEVTAAESGAASGARSAFSALQTALSEGGALIFHAFDLLSRDGEDLTDAPLRDRRAALEALFAHVPGAGGPVRLTPVTVGQGPAAHAAACAVGTEGIVSKRIDAPYSGTRTKAWLKVKCAHQREFVVGGYAPSDKAGRPFASLLLGAYRDGALVYRGRVGTGFSDDDLERLAARFRPRKTSPFAEVPQDVRRDARWITPELVAEVRFTEITHEGHLRHPSFLGLRADKPAEAVQDETPQEAPGRDEPEIAGVTVTHATREVFPDAGCTKADVARHYARVGPRMAPLVARHPLSLVRCPEGIGADCFYQKHARKGVPEALGRVEIAEKGGERATYMTADDTGALVAAAQFGAVEVHIWNARTDRLERPDRMVLDLDPGPGVDWVAVVRAARDVRGHLDALDLDCGALVTGGKGIHVWMALRRISGWDRVKRFAETFARTLAAREPERFTATASKSEREGRIFIDWLRNERGATAIAPYSLRARPGAPVAVPVTWEELADLEGANTFKMADMEARLAQECPYDAQRARLQSIGKKALARLDAWAEGA
jgi:bifunctional non-homologous end joining protein LigD